MRRSELLTMVSAGLTAAADTVVPVSYNQIVDVSSCKSLSCNPRNGSVCSTIDIAGPPKGVGIAANAVDFNSTSLSFSLITGMGENGFTGVGSAQYEHSDQQLFVGLDPNLAEESYPSGCVLMMQYLAQTFPLEPYPNTDTRSAADKNTTSCDGVLDIFCQSDLSDIIRSFNTTKTNNSSSSDADKCTLLTSHVNARLQENDGTCSGEGKWIANFMNVTGGALPEAKSASSEEFLLGNDDCKPALPADYQLYKVATMRQLYFADPPTSDSDYYGKVFGGQAGWTPVITVFYSGDEEAEISDSGVQFSCLQTFQADGEARDDIFESAAGILPRMSSFALLAVFVGGGFVLFM